jgi:hypothetical protein
MYLNRIHTVPQEPCKFLKYDYWKKVFSFIKEGASSKYRAFHNSLHSVIEGKWPECRDEKGGTQKLSKTFRIVENY